MKIFCAIIANRIYNIDIEGLLLARFCVRAIQLPRLTCGLVLPSATSKGKKCISHHCTAKLVDNFAHNCSGKQPAY